MGVRVQYAAIDWIDGVVKWARTWAGDDECHTVIPTAGIIRRIKGRGGRGLVLLAGVQTNQFPRAMAADSSFPAKAMSTTRRIGSPTACPTSRWTANCGSAAGPSSARSASSADRTAATTGGRSGTCCSMRRALMARLRNVRLALLTDGAVLTRTRLREQLGVKNERLGQTLESLERAGQLRRTPTGWQRAD